MELFIETFDVQAMVRDVVDHDPAAGGSERQHAGGRPAPTISGSMRADLTKVRQILFNLLSNASKFTQNGAHHADGRAGRRRDWVHFRVTDTGIGMSAEQMEKLFQDFTQVDASTTRKYGGTGLGLAISRRFCRMMGGEITAAEQPRRGGHVRVPDASDRRQLCRPTATPAADVTAGDRPAGANGTSAQDPCS